MLNEPFQKNTTTSRATFRDHIILPFNTVFVIVHSPVETFQIVGELPDEIGERDDVVGPLSAPLPHLDHHVGVGRVQKVTHHLHSFQGVFLLNCGRRLVLYVPGIVIKVFCD